MNKFIKLFLSTLMVLTVATVIIPNHEHDETCGYDPKTGTGCIYENGLFYFPPGEQDPND
jgi:hypothetical protein